MTPKNFEWQFDDKIFERIVDGNGLGNSLSISTELASFAINTVRELETLQISGPKPIGYLPAMDIDEFPELLAKVINKKQELEGVLERDRLQVKQSYSDLRPDGNMLLWKLKSRKPGLFAQGKIGSDHVQEYTMHQRGVFKDPYEPGHSIVAFGQKMDNYIELSIISSDPQTANRLAIWLEETLDENRWIFQYHGIERVIFNKREEDSFEDVKSNLCHKRTLVYYVRTEKIVLHRVALLRKLIFELCVSPPGTSAKQSSQFSSVLKS